VLLGSLFDLSPGQTEPHLPRRFVDLLDGSCGHDVVGLVEVMSMADDEIALTGRVACPRDLACMPVGRLDLKAFDAVVVAKHSFRKRPETIVLER
jgi:hypothetical protein